MSTSWPTSFATLRRAVLDGPVDAAASTVARWTAEHVGGTVVLRLADRAGHELHPVGASADDADTLEVWSLEEGAAADALWRRSVRREGGDGGSRVHVPAVVRGAAQGVLTVEAPRVEVDDGCWSALGEVVAILLGQVGLSTDTFEVRRRSHSYSVSAELQWQLLPPTSVVVDGAELHALIEPAPRVSSDLFDWSLDGGRLWFVVLDAEGRNLSAALPAPVALAALRHARRSGLPLVEQVSLADQAVHDQFRGHAVVRALVAELDLGGGSAQVVAAGDAEVVPRILRRRGGRVEELHVTEHEDLGRFERSPYRVEDLDVAPGDDLLVVTDGGPGAGDGAFGMPAVVERFAAMAVPSAHPRRLLDLVRRHSDGELAQDATALVVRLTG